MSTNAHNSQKYLLYHRESPKAEICNKPDECARDGAVQVGNKALNADDRLTLKIILTGTVAPSHPEEPHLIRCTGYLSSVSLSGAFDMTNNYGISTYDISKYSRKISQSSVDMRNTSNGGEWEHCSGSGLRLLLERTVMNSGGPDRLVLRIFRVCCLLRALHRGRPSWRAPNVPPGQEGIILLPYRVSD